MRHFIVITALAALLAFLLPEEAVSKSKCITPKRAFTIKGRKRVRFKAPICYRKDIKSFHSKSCLGKRLCTAIRNAKNRKYWIGRYAANVGTPDPKYCYDVGGKLQKVYGVKKSPLQICYFNDGSFIDMNFLIQAGWLYNK